MTDAEFSYTHITAFTNNGFPLEQFFPGPKSSGRNVIKDQTPNRR